MNGGEVGDRQTGKTTQMIRGEGRPSNEMDAGQAATDSRRKHKDRVNPD